MNFLARFLKFFWHNMFLCFALDCFNTFFFEFFNTFFMENLIFFLLKNFNVKNIGVKKYGPGFLSKFSGFFLIISIIEFYWQKKLRKNLICIIFNFRCLNIRCVNIRCLNFRFRCRNFFTFLPLFWRSFFPPFGGFFSLNFFLTIGYGDNGELQWRSSTDSGFLNTQSIGSLIYKLNNR